MSEDAICCFVCQHDASGSLSRVECERCGLYKIDEGGRAVFENAAPLKPAFALSASHRIRMMSRDETPNITKRVAERILSAAQSKGNKPITIVHLFFWIWRVSKGEFAATPHGWAAIVGGSQKQALRRLTLLDRHKFLLLSKDRQGARVSFTEKSVKLAEDFQRGRRRAMRPASRQASLPSYILELSIQKMKCFRDKQTIRFTHEDGRLARWTVILGDNGVGKTTLLQLACALLLDWDTTTVVTAGSKSKSSVGSSDFLKRFDQFKTDDSSFFVKYSLGQNLGKEAFNWCESGLTSEHSSLFLWELLAEYDAIGISSSGRSVFGTYWAGKRRHLAPSLIAGFGANRVSSAPNFYIKKPEEQEPYSTLFEVSPYLRDAETWYLKADYAARFKSEFDSVTSRNLDRIRRSLLKILPMVRDIFVEPPTPDQPEPKLRFKTELGDIAFGDLGLGYKNTISMLVDLAQSFIARYEKSDDPLSEPAIVFIDEMELHLHPKWQRDIIKEMQSIFSKTQFIVTTHSPLIVQGIEDPNIILLIAGKDGVKAVRDRNDVSSWRTDQVLTSELFDLGAARSTPVENLLEEKRKISRKSQLARRDRERLNEIERELGAYPLTEDLQEDRVVQLLRSLISNREASLK